MVNNGKDTEPRRAVSMRTVAPAAFVDAFLEWYDFNFFAIAAPLVLNQLFFPTASPILGTFAAFLTFGVGFIFRPIGWVPSGSI